MAKDRPLSERKLRRVKTVIRGSGKDIIRIVEADSTEIIGTQITRDPEDRTGKYTMISSDNRTTTRKYADVRRIYTHIVIGTRLF